MKFAAIGPLLLLATAALAAPPHSEWPKYCGNLSMTGTAQSGGAISPQSAPFLTPLWSLKLSGPIASQPTVADDKIYIGDWSGTEWAIDADSGLPVAQAYLGMTTQAQCDPPVLGITSSATIVDGIAYLAGGDDAFYALDGDTLDVVWRQVLGNNSAGYYGWCSPAVAGARVLQGVSSNCDDPFIPGRLVGLDLFDGSMVDESLMIAPDPSAAYTVGSGIWTSPAVDTVNHDIFVTTASAYEIQDGLAYSMVRINLDDLQVAESWKLIDADPNADADWGTSPTLFVNSNGDQLVGAGQKDGHYYAFNRRSIANGPVWKSELANGGACPQCADGIISTAAYDGIRLYVGTGRPVGGDPNDIGAIYALNPDDGSVIWEHTFPAAVLAPISYANGVIFTTTGFSGVALDAATGRLLWQGQTEATCYGGVAITDRGIFFGDLAGNLYAYGVPANVPPPKTRAVRTH